MATDKKQLQKMKKQLEDEFNLVKSRAVKHEQAIGQHQQELAKCSSEMARLQGKYAVIQELLGEKPKQ